MESVDFWVYNSLNLYSFLVEEVLLREVQHLDKEPVRRNALSALLC
jgi:hypothetical protein